MLGLLSPDGHWLSSFLHICCGIVACLTPDEAGARDGKQRGRRRAQGPSDHQGTTFFEPERG